VLGPNRESINNIGVPPCIVACTETDMVQQALYLIANNRRGLYD